MKGRYVGFFLLLPSLIVFAVILVYPILYSLQLSLTDKYALSTTMNFIGFKNYISTFEDPLFYNALKIGLIFAGGSVVIQFAIGLIGGLLLNERFRGRTFFRAIFIFPWFMPHIVSILIWRWMLHDYLGIFNYSLIQLGLLSSPRGWLGETDTALIMVLFINAWIFSPYITIWILARLQLIPEALYESAKIDGAGTLKRFWHITLPELKGVLAIILLLRTIWMFNKFDTIWLLTEGGPLHRTETIPIYAYSTAFVSFEQGLGCAVSNIVFIGLAIFSVFYLRRTVVY